MPEARLAGTARWERWREEPGRVAARASGACRGKDEREGRALGGLDALVANGTIDQSQADAIQSRVAAGSVDTTEVVASRVLAAQMDQARRRPADDHAVLRRPVSR